MASSSGGKAKIARHVYKTGATGCGGKAAPTAAKNSGVPLPCPFCDRIFKQDGRLKEHLKNKHADESPDGLPATEDGNSVQPDSAGVGGGANEFDQGQTQRQSSYPIKTPKTLLHEWCQKNKRPVPKFKHVEEDGGFHCRVILPDAKKSEADVILWYRDTPTRSSQEAQHRAAVVGLHHVLGNRRLDRILAEEYRQQWHDLDMAAEKRKAYLKANPPQPRSKPAPLPRELHSVFMSENNRRLVEGLLRVHENGEDSTSDILGGQSDDVSCTEDSRQGLRETIEVIEDWRKEKPTATSHHKVLAEETWEQHKTPNRGIARAGDLSGGHRVATGMQAVTRKLLSLGFAAHHVKIALIERHDLSSALDWLILNVPEQDLPTKFAPDASKASVQVLVRGKREASDISVNVDQDSLSHLQQYGYAIADCVVALSEANGDEEMALCTLFHSAFDGLRINSGSGPITENIAELIEIRDEEAVVLQASFGEEVLISESLRVFDLSIPGATVARLVMEVRIPPGSTYPLELPVISFRSKELPGELLLDLTKQLVGKAAVSLGRPMIYELVHLATELGQELIVKYLGPSAESKWDLELTLPSVDATLTPYNEVAGVKDNLMVSNLSSFSRSTGIGGDLSIAKAYIPPALRKASSGTALELKDQQMEALGTQNHLQSVSKIRVKDAGIDVDKESTKLKMEWEQLQKSERHADMRAIRSMLPAFQQRDGLLSVVNSHPVTIVAGQTGCGKSTQVPQYVLEDYIERDKGGLCNIICTQPRRLSAIGLADRVSKERGQAVGETIGYTVRLESNRSRHTRLLFCTTGILLRRLLSDPDLEGVTHVVVDEVHERSLESDLLLLLLRELLKRAGGQLHLILMSATVDTTLFLHYFRQEDLDPCIVSIPGFTFPVQELYLEDALDFTGYKVGRNSRYAMRKKISSSDLPNLASSMESTSPLSEDMDNWESLAADKGKEDKAVMDVYSEATQQSLSFVDQSLINYDLIELLICAILQETLPKVSEPSSGYMEGHRGNCPGACKQVGAVLVFLPGVAEIRRLQRQLQSSSQIAASHSGSLWVLALHGSLSSDEQRRVFSRPSPGTRKIVLATNIAETSVTIDDVVYVIDCGRHKEMRYDHSRGISCLEETWVSKASAKQRRGRAGRVQSGYCIRLFSRHQFQTFEDQQLPEILRVSLDGLCLKVKSFLVEKVEVAASKIITPPELGAIRTSLQNLQDLNALDAFERLTPLGHHLARMPVDARVGKMLLFGCMLRCLDPVVTIAAALSGRTPFLSPLDKREEASAARLRFAGTSKSDHWTIVGAYNGWLNARQEGRSAESNYCSMNFLSRETLLGIEASRLDFLKILADIGFLPGTSKGIDYNCGFNELDLNSNSIRVVKAVICAGFYPNIVRVLHPEKTYVQTEGGTVAKVAAARELRFFTKADGRVFLHPASVNFSIGKFESPWLVFSEKMKTSKVFLKDSTMVPAYGLLLFGGKVQVKHEKQAMTVDDWLEFEAPARIAVLIKELRSKVDSLLFEKIERPALDISSSPVVSALIRLLTTDGF